MVSLIEYVIQVKEKKSYCNCSNIMFYQRTHFFFLIYSENKTTVVTYETFGQALKTGSLISECWKEFEKFTAVASNGATSTQQRVAFYIPLTLDTYRLTAAAFVRIMYWEPSALPTAHGTKILSLDFVQVNIIIILLLLYTEVLLFLLENFRKNFTLQKHNKI